MENAMSASLRDAARAMQDAAERGLAVPPLLEKHCPDIYRQLGVDRGHPRVFSFWGRSLNADAHAGQTIVDPAVLRAIGVLAGVPMRGRVVHAGLQHTYGYLFSLIQTPYGLKRDRWVSEDWERGFGFDHSLLGPQPRAGTLLANLTWFVGHIAYRGLAGPLGGLRKIAATVAPELAGYDFDRLKVCRLEERTMPAPAGRGVRIVSDLVSYPYPPNSRAENTVLIYSVQNGPHAALKIVTAFPVTQSTVDELKASISPRTPIHLRYNAYLPGFLSRGALGTRRIQCG